MPVPFEIGDVVHHNGEEGRFVVKKLREDGLSLDAFGGLGYVPGERNVKCHAAWRTFWVKDCRPAKKQRKLRVED